MGATRRRLVHNGGWPRTQPYGRPAMKPAIILIVVLVLAFPFLIKLIPEGLSVEGIAADISAAGYNVSEPTPVEPAQREAAEQWVLKAGAGEAYRVEVYRYDNGAKLTTNYEYLKPDAGTVIVEATNMANELGAARPKTQTAVGKRGKWVVHVMGPERAQCEALVRAAIGR